MHFVRLFPTKHGVLGITVGRRLPEETPIRSAGWEAPTSSRSQGEVHHDVPRSGTECSGMRETLRSAPYPLISAGNENGLHKYIVPIVCVRSMGTSFGSIPSETRFRKAFRTFLFPYFCGSSSYRIRSREHDRLPQLIGKVNPFSYRMK